MVYQGWAGNILVRNGVMGKVINILKNYYISGKRLQTEIRGFQIFRYYSEENSA